MSDGAWIAIIISLELFALIGWLAYLAKRYENGPKGKP